jgi:hypothetical protein
MILIGPADPPAPLSSCCAEVPRGLCLARDFACGLSRRTSRSGAGPRQASSATPKAYSSELSGWTLESCLDTCSSDRLCRTSPFALLSLLALISQSCPPPQCSSLCVASWIAAVGGLVFPSQECNLLVQTELPPPLPLVRLTCKGY